MALEILRKSRLFNDDSVAKFSLNIVQWNILAQGFVPASNFVHVDPNDLDLNSRLNMFVDSFNVLKPDICTLQEADIVDVLVNKLNSSTTCKYNYVFLPKGNSPCLAIDNNYGPDGVAILYRSDLFKVINKCNVPLDVHENHRALVMHFEHIGSSIDFYVVSLHLKAKPEFSERRLDEGKFLMNHIKASTDMTHKPLIICGDFNAKPDEPVVNLFKSDKDVPLKSAYQSVYGDEAPFTTWKIRHASKSDGHEVKHTIDYILYRNVRLSNVLEIPDDDSIGAKALPSKTFPSDHLNLQAIFKFT